MRVGKNKTCTPSHNNGGKKTSKKLIHQPDESKNMRIKNAKSGFETPEPGERLSTSLFDPRTPGDRSLHCDNEDWKKLAETPSGKSAMFCFLKTDYVAKKVQGRLILITQEMWQNLNISLIITYVLSFSLRKYCL